MSSGKLNVATDPRLATPLVQLTRIQKIDTVEVMVTELQQIEEAATEEKTALSFFSLFLGAVISAALSAPASDASPKRWAIYTSLTALCAVFMVWFFLTWLRKRKHSTRILAGIRARAGTVQQSVAIATSPTAVMLPAGGGVQPGSGGTQGP